MSYIRNNMSVTFRYIRNGNLVTFKDSVDIDSMRIHPEYEEVSSVEEVKQEPFVIFVEPEPQLESTVVLEPPKRTYRSRKVEVNTNKED